MIIAGTACAEMKKKIAYSAIYISAVFVARRRQKKLTDHA